MKRQLQYFSLTLQRNWAHCALLVFIIVFVGIKGNLFIQAR